VAEVGSTVVGSADVGSADVVGAPDSSWLGGASEVEGGGVGVGVGDDSPTDEQAARTTESAANAAKVARISRVVMHLA